VPINKSFTYLPSSGGVNMKFRLNKTSGKWVGYQKSEITIDIDSPEELVRLLHVFSTHEIIIKARYLQLNNGKFQPIGEDKDVVYEIEIVDDYRE
jgi:hypothetical protein